MDLSPIVRELCNHRLGENADTLRLANPRPLPSRDIIVNLVEELRTVLFPGYYGTSDINALNMTFHVGSTLDHLLRAFTEQIRRALCFNCEEAGDPTCTSCDPQALAITREFTRQLPAIQAMLLTDVQAAFDGDPAAKSMDEAIFCYPGILAITSYRIAHELLLLEVPIIPRIITEHAHSLTGIDIHPGARIGEGVFIDHGTGVVIGQTCVIGTGVKIYQGVTLGARSFPKDEHGNPVKGIPRHPIVEDNVTIYSNATVLGRITIGAGSVIGGNVWLTRSVDPGSRISQAAPHEELHSDGAGI